MGSINVVLLDLDGVIRHFDADHLAAVEQHNNLPPGTLQAAAFEPVLAEQVVTGKMSFDDWVHRVGEIVGSQRAAEAWLHEVGRIDWDLVSIVDDLRAAGTTVAVLTNGTDTVQRELDELGVTSHFDAIYNSALSGTQSQTDDASNMSAVNLALRQNRCSSPMTPRRSCPAQSNSV